MFDHRCFSRLSQWLFSDVTLPGNFEYIAQAARPGRPASAEKLPVASDNANALSGGTPTV